MIAPQFLNSVAVSDSFLSNAGWFFLASWSAIITIVSVIAFGQELLPWKARKTPRPR